MALGTITGTYRVVADPELGFGGSGTAYANVRLVASRTRKNADGTYEDLANHWATAKAFGPLAEQLNEQLRKGTQVEVWGNVQTDQWDDKDTGQKRSRDIIMLNGFRAYASRDQGQSQGFQQASQDSRATQGQAQRGGDPWGQAPQSGSFGASQGFDAPF